jgi:hypothetical protein
MYLHIEMKPSVIRTESVKGMIKLQNFTQQDNVVAILALQCPEIISVEAFNDNVLGLNCFFPLQGI